MGGNTLRGDSPPVKSIVLSDEKGVSDDRPRESSPLSLESILPQLRCSGRKYSQLKKFLENSGL
jgi:hypothetical protein